MMNICPACGSAEEAAYLDRCPGCGYTPSHGAD
jgi:hypothetical protein